MNKFVPHPQPNPLNRLPQKGQRLIGKGILVPAITMATIAAAQLEAAHHPRDTRQPNSEVWKPGELGVL